MGNGVTIQQLPMQVNKEQFRQLTGGKINDFIFDAYATNGLLSRETLYHLSQIKDVYFSFHESTDERGRNIVDKVMEIGNGLKTRNLQATCNVNIPVDSHLVSTLCGGIDNSRCVVCVFTLGYLREICGNEANSKCKIEFVYAIRKKQKEHVIPIVLDPSLANPAAWPPQLLQALSGMPFMDFTNDANISANTDNLFQRITDATRAVVIPAPKSLDPPSKDEREENQFYQWMTRSTSIEENRRIVYCASLVSAGITNVHKLAQRLNEDKHFLTNIGVNDYDADAMCQAVGLLCIGYTYTRDFGAMQSFDSALFVLKKSIDAPEDHALAANALGTAARIAEQGPAMVQQMHDGGFCAAIVRVTQKHLARAHVVEQACRACAVLCRESDACRESFGVASVSFFLSRSLQGHMEVPSLVQWNCAAIAALCKLHTNKERLGTAGICEIVVKAVTKNAMHEEVAVEGCYAMEMLQTDYYSNTAKLGNSGCHDTLTMVLRSHAGSVRVAEAAYKCMNLLALDYDNRSQLGSVVCDVFINSLRNCVQSPIVAFLGCKAIHSIVVGKASHRDNLGQAGACEVVRAALETHPTDSNVVLFACQAAYSLAKGSGRNLARFQGVQRTLQAITAKRQSFPVEVQQHLQEAILTFR
jgi:hypothetical protein